MKKKVSEGFIVLVITFVVVFFGVVLLFYLFSSTGNGIEKVQEEGVLYALGDFFSFQWVFDIQGSVIKIPVERSIAEYVVSREDVLGSWKGVREEVLGQVFVLTNSTIEFATTGYYYERDEGVVKKGSFIVKDGKILFPDPSDNEKEGIYREAFVEITGDELTLIYPRSLRVLSYTRSYYG